MAETEGGPPEATAEVIRCCKVTRFLMAAVLGVHLYTVAPNQTEAT